MKQKYTIWWNADDSIIMKYNGDKEVDDEDIFESFSKAKTALMRSIVRNQNAWERAYLRVMKMKASDARQ